jgi:hypothetical protein
VGPRDRWRECEAGVSSIEGAIVLLAYTVLMFMIMEFLFVFFAYSSVIRSAENIARYAMVHNTCNVSSSAAQVALIPITISSQGCSPAPASCQAGVPVPYSAQVYEATVLYDFQTTGFFTGFLASTLPIQASVCVPLIL